NRGGRNTGVASVRGQVRLPAQRSGDGALQGIRPDHRHAGKHDESFTDLGAQMKTDSNSPHPLIPSSPHLLNRRRFLRAAGVSLALPWLDALAGPGTPAAGPPRRMVCVCTPLGLHPPYFFPQEAGREYRLTPYLEPLREFRDDFTVISGLAHPEVG